MRIIEAREKVVDPTAPAKRQRGLITGRVVFTHQDPDRHPYNNYSEGDKQRDREVHENLDWLREQVEQRHRENEERQRERERDKDRDR